MSGIVIGKDIYMVTDGSEVHFPMHRGVGNVQLLHGPQNICGYESEQLVLGVISKGIENGDTFSWTRNGTVLGENSSILYVNETGQINGNLPVIIKEVILFIYSSKFASNDTKITLR